MRHHDCVFSLAGSLPAGEEIYTEHGACVLNGGYGIRDASGRVHEVFYAAGCVDRSAVGCQGGLS